MRGWRGALAGLVLGGGQPRRFPRPAGPLAPAGQRRRDVRRRELLADLRRLGRREVRLHVVAGERQAHQVPLAQLGACTATRTVGEAMLRRSPAGRQYRRVDLSVTQNNHAHDRVINFR